MPAAAMASETATGVWLNGKALPLHGRDGGSIPSAPNSEPNPSIFRHYYFFDVVT